MYYKSEGRRSTERNTETGRHIERWRISDCGATDGFTLIELLIVISLITILATMGLVQYRNSITSSKEAVLSTDLFRMRDAIDQYYADKNKYPSSLDALVSDGYMRKIPEDPITKSADTWQTVPAEPDPEQSIGASRGSTTSRAVRQEPRSTDARTRIFEGVHSSCVAGRALETRIPRSSW